MCCRSVGCGMTRRTQSTAIDFGPVLEAVNETSAHPSLSSVTVSRAAVIAKDAGWHRSLLQPFWMKLTSALPLVECTGNASSSAGTKSDPAFMTHVRGSYRVLRTAREKAEA